MGLKIYLLVASVAVLCSYYHGKKDRKLYTVMFNSIGVDKTILPTN